MVARVRAAGALAFALLLPGCTAVVPIAPHEVGAVPSTRRVIVTLDGPVLGEEVELRRVSLDGAVLRGTAIDGRPMEIELERIAAVRMKETREAPALLLALVPAAAVQLWLMQEQADAPEPPPSSSCPMVYAHDGEGWVFQAEPYGGSIVPALKRTEWTPLPSLRPVDGEYRLLIANELDETQYIDRAQLVVVDHPAGTRVAADPEGAVQVFRDPVRPRRATDSSGRDWTAALRDNDRTSWSPTYDDMQGPARETLRDPLIVEFPKPAGASVVRILVNGATSVWGSIVAREFLALRGDELAGWREELSRSGPALMELVSWFVREGLYVLPLEVETPAGWEERGALLGSGPFAFKSTAYLLDIGDVPGETLRIRIPAPVGFWTLNAIAAEFDDPPPFHAEELATTTVRGAGGRPVQALLSDDDGRELVMSEIGDRVEVAFPVPPPRPGMDRTVLLEITGHYDVHMPAEGEPRHAVLRRILEEPGYTLRFAYEKYLERRSTSRVDR